MLDAQAGVAAGVHAVQQRAVVAAAAAAVRLRLEAGGMLGRAAGAARQVRALAGVAARHLVGGSVLVLRSDEGGALGGVGVWVEAVGSVRWTDVGAARVVAVVLQVEGEDPEELDDRVDRVAVVVQGLGLLVLREALGEHEGEVLVLVGLAERLGGVVVDLVALAVLVKKVDQVARHVP